MVNPAGDPGELLEHLVDRHTGLDCDQRLEDRLGSAFVHMATPVGVCEGEFEDRASSLDDCRSLSSPRIWPLMYSEVECAARLRANALMTGRAARIAPGPP